MVGRPYALRQQEFVFGIFRYPPAFGNTALRSENYGVFQPDGRVGVVEHIVYAVPFIGFWGPGKVFHLD